MQIITTTNNRAKAFNQLASFVKKQEYQEFEWLIVCDGNAEQYNFPKSKSKVIIRDTTNDTMPSLCHNLLTALENVTHDKVVIMEDDDYYHPMYLSTMNKMLDRADLVGLCENVYYWVLERKAHRRHNTNLAALASTGWKKSVNKFVQEIAQKSSNHIDVGLWREYVGKKLLVNNFTQADSNARIPYKIDGLGNIENEHPLHVGLKGNWHGGEDGLTQSASGGGIDQTGRLLKKWLGDDAGFYLKFTVEQNTDKPKPFVLFEMPNT